MNLEELRKLDKEDELREFRGQFHIPKHDGKDTIYLCGNSLGLLPKQTSGFVSQELESWKENGVKGHFLGDKPWVSYHELAKKPLGELVGGNPNEVQAVGSLTSNLHLLLASFYQPNGDRKKVIIESGAFPSDFYAVHSHMKMKGVDPEEHLVELKAKDGGEYLPNEEVIEMIYELGDELALVLFPGVQYYSGQFFDISSITIAAHKAGAFAGFDLAHAVGNIPMNLHDDGVDFAVWCSYKYLNSGPGGIGGMFVHERNGSNLKIPKLTGWWGHDSKERFEMANRLNPIPGVDGWQLSNVNILSSAAHLASLELFQQAGIDRLRKKSLKMTELLIEALEEFEEIEIITPKSVEERGCQVSMYVNKNGRDLFDSLTNHGVVADWREPNVIRIAPVPLYNTFEELGLFSQILKAVLLK